MTWATATAYAACPELERVGLRTGNDDGVGGSGRSGADGIGGSGRRPAPSVSVPTPAPTPTPTVKGSVALEAGGDDDGIGGSGLESGDDDGIGGSGLYGTVTGFGSICLNGRRITYADDVPVNVAGGIGTADDLAVGQVVQVVARNDVAERIEVKHAVVGRVEAVDADRVRIRVVEADVEVEVRVAAESSIDTAAVEPGSRVAVSGLWHPDGSVVASRVEVARDDWNDGTTPPIAVDMFTSEVVDIDVEGYVVRADARAIEVGAVRFEPDDPANLPAVGERVRVRALRDDAGQLRVRELDRIRPPRLQMERPDRSEIGAARKSDRPDANERTARRDDAHAHEREGPHRPPVERARSDDISRPELPPRPPTIDRPRPTDFRDRPRPPRPGPPPPPP